MSEFDKLVRERIDKLVEDDRREAVAKRALLLSARDRVESIRAKIESHLDCASIFLSIEKAERNHKALPYSIVIRSRARNTWIATVRVYDALDDSTEELQELIADEQLEKVPRLQACRLFTEEYDDGDYVSGCVSEFRENEIDVCRFVATVAEELVSFVTDALYEDHTSSAEHD